ncbi:DNA-processing protein DprA [Pseudactinotalea suaedae]|uniref:DNA-processing protein DprA n=1 Tax=Pseudactinotalea suaedae TaxID=1524924 RepID=UPI0012E13561|nr:DNA-processing protein DprA [Pseudactinotalea suaedae]
MAERLAFDATDELLATVAWSRISEPGEHVAGALVRALGPVAALDWVRSESQQPPGVPPHIGWQAAAARWRPRLQALDPRRELEAIRRRSGTVVLPDDPRWPRRLDDLGDRRPMCLYVLGSARIASITHRAVAVVGARACTDYGRHVARELGVGLTGRGVTVVSGGAFGIDAAVHKAAVVEGGPALAVMAGGLDRLYPRDNLELLEEVIENGAVVSEAPPGTAPMRQRFLARNRLIAALSEATVVVEAAWRSGALSTARQAAELLRPVGAVPGAVTSMASSGCHRLLREGVAVCVTDVGEVLELTAGLEPAAEEPFTQPGLLDGLGPQEARVLDALPVRAAAEVDNLVRVCGLSVTETLGALGLLEMAGRVERSGAGWRRRQS